MTALVNMPTRSSCRSLCWPIQTGKCTGVSVWTKPLDALRAALTSVPGVRLLDVQADASHHRSVFTFVASPDAAVEAAFRAIRTARERIDLTRHQGEHPRMGATDVVPFVPLEGATMDDCVQLARRLGERVGTELEIPVYLYARAATRPERVRLPDIRKGEFEGLAAKMMKVSPEECLMIGDTTVDIRAGRSAGAQTAGVLCGFGEEYELRKMGADAIFDITPSVLNVLLR